MEIHNLLEEIVKSSVDEYCNSLPADKRNDCDCEQCRLDVICYVLNNMLPKYVVSSRGIIHHELDYSKKIQLEADILHLVKKGFSIVLQRKRPGINHNGKIEGDIKKGPYYNFPNIIGKVINGTTFEPIADAEVTLFMNDDPVYMTSDLMSNPITLNQYTRGMFTFWPYPVKAHKTGAEKTFTFKITVTHPEFNDYTKLLDIAVTAEDNFLDSIQLQNTKTIEDIFLFPKGV